jgi:hypothetical protein
VQFKIPSPLQRKKTIDVFAQPKTIPIAWFAITIATILISSIIFCYFIFINYTKTDDFLSNYRKSIFKSDTLEISLVSPPFAIYEIKKNNGEVCLIKKENGQYRTIVVLTEKAHHPMELPAILEEYEIEESMAILRKH